MSGFQPCKGRCVPYPKSSNTFEVYSAGNTTLEIDTLVKMVLLVRSFRHQLDEHLRKIGHSTARMEALSAILNMPGDKSQSDVAKRLRVEGATITRMIDMLSKQGLVERSPHPQDRRVNLLSITPAGKDAVREMFRCYDRLRNHLLYDVADEELQLLNGLIGKMLVRLDIPLDDTVDIQPMPAIYRISDQPLPDAMGQD
jgi:MarR family transcriptional regulator for hemolysin